MSSVPETRIESAFTNADWADRGKGVTSAFRRRSEGGVVGRQSLRAQETDWSSLNRKDARKDMNANRITARLTGRRITLSSPLGGSPRTTHKGSMDPLVPRARLHWNRLMHVINGNIDCVICMEVVLGNGMTTSCGHQFHAECLQCWLQTSPNADCPVCRAVLVAPTLEPPMEGAVNPPAPVGWGTLTLPEEEITLEGPGPNSVVFEGNATYALLTRYPTRLESIHQVHPHLWTLVALALTTVRVEVGDWQFIAHFPRRSIRLPLRRRGVFRAVRYPLQDDITSDYADTILLDIALFVYNYGSDDEESIELVPRRDYPNLPPRLTRAARNALMHALNGNICTCGGNHRINNNNCPENDQRPHRNPDKQHSKKVTREKGKQRTEIQIGKERFESEKRRCSPKFSTLSDVSTDSEPTTDEPLIPEAPTHPYDANAMEHPALHYGILGELYRRQTRDKSIHAAAKDERAREEVKAGRIQRLVWLWEETIVESKEDFLARIPGERNDAHSKYYDMSPTEYSMSDHPGKVDLIKRFQKQQGSHYLEHFLCTLTSLLGGLITRSGVTALICVGVSNLALRWHLDRQRELLDAKIHSMYLSDRRVHRYAPLPDVVKQVVASGKIPPKFVNDITYKMATMRNTKIAAIDSYSAIVLSTIESARQKAAIDYPDINDEDIETIKLALHSAYVNNIIQRSIWHQKQLSGLSVNQNF